MLEREMMQARREAEAIRSWRMMQARQLIERRRPFLSTNLVK